MSGLLGSPSVILTGPEALTLPLLDVLLEVFELFEVPELLEETSKIVVIDHHRKSPEYIEKSILVNYS